MQYVKATDIPPVVHAHIQEGNLVNGTQLVSMNDARLNNINFVVVSDVASMIDRKDSSSRFVTADDVHKQVATLRANLYAKLHKCETQLAKEEEYSTSINENMERHQSSIQQHSNNFAQMNAKIDGLQAALKKTLTTLTI